MPVPTVDFDNMVVNMLPLKQRLKKWMLLLKALISPVKWLYQLFTAFMNGEAPAQYNPATAYAKGNKARYNFRVWESLTDANTGNTPDTSPGNWILRNNSFIGARRRATYNGRYLNLTHYLNTQFGTTFRQLPYPAPYDNGLGGGTWSDIYITNVAPSYSSFVVGEVETGSSAAGTLNSGMEAVPDVEIYTAASSYTFAINMPTAVYNALGISNPIRESVVRSFVDTYVTTGTHYIIVLY